MIIPKLRIKFSSIYNNLHKEYLYYSAGVDKEYYPSNEDVESKITDIKDFWEKYNDDAMEAISKTCNLEWKEDSIDCYIVGRARPFSSPMTISLYRPKRNDVDFERIRDVLIHELIHEIVDQNLIKENFPYIEKNFSSEEHGTKVHIFVLAIYSIVLREMNLEERIELDKEISRKNKFNPEYSRAWEIINQISPDSIQQKFLDYIEKK